MQRFYVDSDLLWKNEYNIIDMDILFQLIKVMRVKKWDKLVLFNGFYEIDYVYKIIEIKKREIILNFIEQIEKDSEINLDLVLYWAFPNKIEKIEYILQKWVEIWFKKFVFFKSQRSQKLNLSENKIIRFNKIMIEATEQSGWNILPELIFEDKLDLNIKWNNIFFHTENNNSKKLKDIQLNFTQPINLFVWPEWWFDEKEIETFNKNKFQNIHLWNRILRTETVWIVVGFYIIHNN